VKTRFCEVIISAGFHAHCSILGPILVGDNHHWNRLKPVIQPDEPEQLDPIQSRHVNVSHYQIVVTGARGIPAIHAVNGHVDRVSTSHEQLTLQFTHCERVVHDQHTLSVFQSFGACLIADLGQTIAGK
jgi:hypothetical protein